MARRAGAAAGLGGAGDWPLSAAARARTLAGGRGLRAVLYLGTVAQPPALAAVGGGGAACQQLACLGQHPAVAGARLAARGGDHAAHPD